MQPTSRELLLLCDAAAILGGSVLALWGWPLSFTQDDLKERSVGDERPAPRWEKLWSVANTHTVAGAFVCV